MNWIEAALYMIGTWVGISLLATGIWCLWAWRRPVFTEDWRSEGNGKPWR